MSAADRPRKDLPPAAHPEDSGLTSLSMLELVRLKDSSAWQRLVHLYSPLIFSWGRRTGLGEEDAADVLQEVWRSVAANIERFERTKDRGTFRGWLWTITRNKLRDHFRGRQGKPAAMGGTDAHNRLQEVPDEEPFDQASSVHGDTPGQFLQRALDLVRNDFEEKTWQAFWRVTVEGKSAADVARELSLSVDSVYQAKSRVLRRLRDELQGLVDWGKEAALPS